MGALNALIAAGFELTDIVLGLYIKLIFAGVILSWLIGFGIVNMHNRFIYVVNNFIDRVTEPFLRPIRRILPPMSGLDLSPLILMLAVYLLQLFFHNMAIQYGFGAYH